MEHGNRQGMLFHGSSTRFNPTRGPIVTNCSEILLLMFHENDACGLHIIETIILPVDLEGLAKFGRSIGPMRGHGCPASLANEGNALHRERWPGEALRRGSLRLRIPR